MKDDLIGAMGLNGGHGFPLGHPPPVALHVRFGITLPIPPIFLLPPTILFDHVLTSANVGDIYYYNSGSAFNFFVNLITDGNGTGLFYFNESNVTSGGEDYGGGGWWGLEGEHLFPLTGTKMHDLGGIFTVDSLAFKINTVQVMSQQPPCPNYVSMTLFFYGKQIGFLPDRTPHHAPSRLWSDRSYRTQEDS